jgi:hypothetical protein
MEAALGAGRFEEYRLTTDGNYGATLSVVEAAGLPKDRARDLVRIQQDYNERAARLRAEAALAGEQTHAALEALATAARQDVGGIVGDRHMNQYLGRAGTWLRQLSPTPAPANR